MSARRGASRTLIGLATGLVAMLPATGALAAEKREAVGTPFPLTFQSQRMAVDESTGNIYINGGYTSTVYIVGATGGAPTAGTPTELTNAEAPKKEPFSHGVAVDNACHQQKLTGSECEAFDPSNGDVYVASPYENAIDKFRLHEGKYEYVCQFVGWGFTGSACLKNKPSREAQPKEFEFVQPQGVAVDNQGNVYITNIGNSTMAAYEFNSSGEQVTKIVSSYPGRPEFVGQSQDVTVDGAGDVFMTPPYGGHILEMKKTGPTSYEQQPIAAAAGSAIAADAEDGRIFTISPEWQVVEYNTNLEYISVISGKNGVPYYPEGLAYDNAAKHVLVSGYSEEFGLYVYTFGSGPIIPDVGLGEPTLTPRSILVHGFVNPDGTTVSTCEIELISQSYAFHEGGAFGPTVEEAQACTVGPGTTRQPVSAEFTGLIPNELYAARVIATNENGTNRSPRVWYQTPDAPPVIKEASASAVTRTTVVLNGIINPENSETTYHFLWGKTSAYTGSTAPVGAGHNLVDQTVNAKLEGLEPGTTYHFALVAENPAGEVRSSDGEFTTASLLPPAVSDVIVSGIEPGAALISGIVHSNGLPSSYEIDFGPDTSYVTKLSGEVVGEQARVELNLIYLIPNTTYHYRIVVRNEDGVAESPDQTFTTPLYPLKIPQILPQVSALIAPFPAEETATFYKGTTPKSKKCPKGKARKHGKCVRKSKKAKKSKGRRRKK